MLGRDRRLFTRPENQAAHKEENARFHESSGFLVFNLVVLSGRANVSKLAFEL